MYPSFQNMASFQTAESAERTFIDTRNSMGATDADIILEDIADAYAYEKPILCHYRLTWATELGWKVYMRTTGVYVI